MSASDTPGSAPTGHSSRSSTDLDSASPASVSHRIVILGGGEAGLAVLQSLDEMDRTSDVALVEPSTYHYDQPAWLRVGTEGIQKEETRSQEAVDIPSDVSWIRDRVARIAPRDHVIQTDTGTTIHYDYLVVALGTEVHWHRIRGLKENLGSRGICSIYGYEQAERTWEMIRAFDGGRALFTAPSSPYKGGSAPLTILRRAQDVWRDTGAWTDTEIIFATAAPPNRTGIDSDETIERKIGADEETDIQVYPGYELIEVRPEHNEAIFSVTKGESLSQDVVRYDLIHVVPPMRPPTLLQQSDLAYREGPHAGYMEVDPDSLRHKRYERVFGVGDVAGIEGEKTRERAHQQAVDVARTLHQIIAQEK